ncbi:hypothetical protein C9I57_02475 [Trinickia symbiotica]|uniref:Uncharacterized protein n=1 Tax=Trinickia symbiotica TaxID=863227 RepID=A0A2T3Y1M6_9BURK|nr:hypothetical protein C9I57_02475 [Trinickia symbiotica]
MRLFGTETPCLCIYRLERRAERSAIGRRAGYVWPVVADENAGSLTATLFVAKLRQRPSVREFGSRCDAFDGTLAGRFEQGSTTDNEYGPVGRGQRGEPFRERCR